MKKKQEAIIVFGAHPDDEVIGVGGTIAKYAQEGKKVIVMIFTQGEGSHPLHKKNLIQTIRRNETKKCAKILGVHKLIHLKLCDGKLKKQLQKPIMTKTVIQVLNQYKPIKIFTHARDDMHKDHVAVHKTVIEAVDIYNKKTKEKTEVYTYNIWSIPILNRNDPQLRVDISKTFLIKQKALEKLKSQKVTLFQLWPTVIIKALLQGFNQKTRFAENFYKIR